MKRPMVYLFFYLASGILLGRYLANALYLLVFCIGFFAILSFILSKKWKNKAPFLFLLFLLFGFGHTDFVLQDTLHTTLEKSILASSIDSKLDIAISGLVTDVSDKNQKRQTATVDVEMIAYKDRKLNQKLKLYVIMPENKYVKLWDTVYINTELCHLENNTVPGGYNEWLYLTTRGFDYKIFPDDVTVVGSEPPFLISQLRTLRNNMQNVFDLIFPEAEAGIIKAMTTGDKTYILEETRELYQQAGITHILAISGMHVSALAMLLFFFLEQLQFISRRISALIVICFLILFAIFTGCSASTVRAVIMVSVGMIGIFLYRTGDSLNNIAIAGVLILVFKPLYLFDIGFQMSFITVTGILLCLNVLKQYSTMPNWKKGIYTSIVATFVSYPVTAYYFHWISLVAVFANIIVIPMMTLLLGMAVATGIVGLFFLPGAVFLGGTVFVIMKFVEWISLSLSSIPTSFVCVGSPSIATVLLWYGAVIAIYCYKPAKWQYKTVLTLVLVSLTVSLVSNKLFLKQNKLTFLDVGQGDSIVLTTYNKQAYVFDTGGWFWAKPGKNTGGYIIAPYLEREGITEIDGLFLSHMDSDHAGGVLDLMDRMRINGLYISDYDFEPSLLYANILITAKNKNIPVYRVSQGNATILEDNISIDCLYPMKQGGLLFGDDNNGSMILRLKIGEISAILTGDASIEDEELLLSDDLDDLLKQTDILKVGHHGSKYSTSISFLQKLQPKLAIISVGEGNSYNHPNDETIKRLNEQSIPIFRTDLQGTITIIINSKNNTDFKIKTTGK